MSPVSGVDVAIVVFDDVVVTDYCFYKRNAEMEE